VVAVEGLLADGALRRLNAIFQESRERGWHRFLLIHRGRWVLIQCAQWPMSGCCVERLRVSEVDRSLQLLMAGALTRGRRVGGGLFRRLRWRAKCDEL